MFLCRKSIHKINLFLVALLCFTYQALGCRGNTSGGQNKNTITSAYAAHMESNFMESNFKELSLEDILQLVFEEGGLESGRSQLCYEESGYSPGGDSDLASLSVKAVVPALIGFLENSEDPEILRRSAYALSLINSKMVPKLATPLLENLLEYDGFNIQEQERQSVRDAAAAALKCMMSYASDPQYRGFTLRESTEVEQEIVQEGQRLTQQEIADEIEEQINLIKWEEFQFDFIYQNEQDQECEECSNDSFWPDYSEYDYEFIRTLPRDFTSFSPGVSSLAGIGYWGELAVTPLLEQLASQESQSSLVVKLSIIKALGNTGSSNPDASRAIFQYLEDTDFLVRNESVIALGKLSLKESYILEALIKRAEDENPVIRASAIAAIGNVENPSAEILSLLEQNLHDDDEYARIHSATAIFNFQGIDQKIKNLAVSSIIEALQSQDPYVRLTATELLNGTTIKDSQIVDSLVYSLSNKQELWETRLNAFSILANTQRDIRNDSNNYLKPFLIEALRARQYKYFRSSNIAYDLNSWIDSSVILTNPIYENDILTYKKRLFLFYSSLPIDKLHAFLLAGLEPQSYPEFNQALREILLDKTSDSKSRYNSAFILGFVEDSSAPFSETVDALKFSMNDPSEDFDVRWMSAVALVRLQQNVESFFMENHLPNPLDIECSEHTFFEPYFGWCELRGSGGDGSSSIFGKLEDFFRRQ